MHPRIKFWMDINEGLLKVAEDGLERARKALRPRRHGSFASRHPGPDSPMWNLLAAHLRDELRPYGAKVRLARYLGIPRQRLTDYLTGRRRLPDAEMTLQLFYWLSEKKSGRDLSM